MSKDDGGLAFPALDDSGTGLCLRESGMTLRDYFAAKALQGVLATPHSWRDMGYTPKDDLTLVEHHAAQAYEIAGAMLAERAK